MTVATGSVETYGMALFDQHRRLLVESGVPADVARERGYVSVDQKTRLEKLGFSPSQRRVPGLLIPVHSVAGGVATYQYRPDSPRLNTKGKPVKYETPGGSVMHLDAHPRIRVQLGSPSTPLFVTEGTRKADSAVARGLCCLGVLGVWNWRGSNDDGGKVALGDWESVHLRDRDVHVVFDSDVMLKAAVHDALARLKRFLESRGATVTLIYLPAGEGGAKTGLDDYLAAGHDVDELLALASSELREPPRPAASESKRPPSQASKMVTAALENYDLGVSTSGEPFAVPKEGAHVARMLRGSRDSLRAEMAKDYFAAEKKAPSSSALADALNVLEGHARETEPVDLALRVGRTEGGIALDLGSGSGAAVVIVPGAWRVVERSPVLFRRTELTGELPLPARGGDLEQLRGLLNLSDDAWPMLVALLVSALIPDIPRPVAAWRGEQGVGKTTSARMVTSVIDPSPVPVRSAPKDLEQWVVAAAGSMVVTLDNLTTIPGWLSDAICRAATGEGMVKRALYTDLGLTVVNFRRIVMMTTIDAGALRGDLADRLVPLDMEPIGSRRRRPDEELAADFARAHPAILGALLDLTADALEVLPNVQHRDLPRMADFARVLIAVDVVNETDSFGRYVEMASRLAEEVVEGDPVASAVVQLVKDRGHWAGTLGDLLRDLAPERPGRGWPATARALSGRLRRTAPSLRRVNVDIVFGEHTRSGTIVELSRLEQGEERDGCVTVGGVGDGRPSHEGATVTPTVTREGAGPGVQTHKRDGVTVNPPFSLLRSNGDEEVGAETSTRVEVAGFQPSPPSHRHTVEDDGLDALCRAFPGAEVLEP